MKTITTSKRTQEKIDRIERAARLIEQGRVTAMGESRWHVQSDAQATGYLVTQTECTCFDFTETLKRQEPCKHIWAAVGATAALLIHDLRRASTLAELERVSKGYTVEMRALPAAFVRVARAEYAKKHDSLRAESRRDEANAIMLKPQPKSNGRVGAIEI